MTNETPEQEKNEYPLSLDETLKLVEKISWQGYNRVPPGFSGGGFYGSVGNAQVRLCGKYLEITASFESPTRFCRREEVYLANYQHEIFGEIWDKLVDQERQDVRKQEKSLVGKLKLLAAS